MKFCSKCGNQVVDEAVVCPNCGCRIASDAINSESSTLRTIALVFMILSCIGGAFALLIPLAWMLPMTLKFNRAIKNNEPVSLTFKVCTLIFVNPIAGILMICDSQN